VLPLSRGNRNKPNSLQTSHELDQSCLLTALSGALGWHCRSTSLGNQHGFGQVNSQVYFSTQWKKHTGPSNCWVQGSIAPLRLKKVGSHATKVCTDMPNLYMSWAVRGP
jgi:hypothetical protein